MLFLHCCVGCGRVSSLRWCSLTLSAGPHAASTNVVSRADEVTDDMSRGVASKSRCHPWWMSPRACETERAEAEDEWSELKGKLPGLPPSLPRFFSFSFSLSLYRSLIHACQPWDKVLRLALPSVSPYTGAKGGAVDHSQNSSLIDNTGYTPDPFISCCGETIHYWWALRYSKGNLVHFCSG